MKQFETSFLNNSFIINSDKAKAMLFHFNKTCSLVKTKIVFNSVEINYTSKMKFWGINISNNLKWNTHIQFLCWKLNKVTLLRSDLGLFMLINIWNYVECQFDATRSHGTIRTIHTTYAVVLKTTTHPETQCRKPYAATQHLMLLMMGVCTRNMSS